jgi:signal transduction histidine kinase
MRSPISQSARITGMNLNSRSPLMKWGIVLGLAGIYLLAFSPLEGVFGPFVTTLVVVPVAAATWYLGLAGGLLGGLLGVLFSVWMLLRGENHSLDELMRLGLPLRALMLVTLVFVIHFISRRIDKFVEAEAQARSREEYLALLNDMTRAILLSKDFDSILTLLAENMAKLINADDCYITRWDDGRALPIPTKTTATLAEPYVFNEKTANRQSMTASVLKAGRALAADDVFNSPYISVDIARRYPTRSVLGVPLIARENKLGAAIIGFNTPHHFTAEEIERAEQAGKHVAIALWSAEQDIELQKRLRESNALVNISLALSETEKIGLKNVLQLIVNSARELMPNTQQAVIHMLDAENQVLIPAAVIGYDNFVEGKRKMRLGEGVAGQVIASGETINITDVDTDARFVKLGTPPAFRSLTVAPVQSGDQKLGTISILSNTPNAFSQREVQLLSALGVQAAIAIENAHLLESIQQSLKETNALYRINQGLASSLKTDRLLKETVDLLQKSFHYYHVQIYVLDPDSGNFVVRAGSGWTGDELTARKHSLSPGEGIVGYAAETGTPFFTNDVDQVVFFTRNPLLPDTKSELAVPVKMGEDILGVLDVQHIPPHDLAQRDIQLVSAVADQLAIALQNANLYEELQISLEHEKAIRNQLVQNERLAVMGRLLATVSHELNNPLQAIQNALFLLREERGISLQGKQDLEIVLAESERMAGMIERLRSTYRATQPQDFQFTQVNNIVQDVLNLITTHLRHNQVTFDFNADPGLPSIPALADQLRQVVLNLLMNAVEAMTDGGQLTVTTKSLPEQSEILLTISDTGSGIEADILPNIFDAFVTNKLRGTGLGLTISYDIIIKHHGRITAENNPGRGSTFSVWLPLENREVI